MGYRLFSNSRSIECDLCPRITHDNATKNHPVIPFGHCIWTLGICRLVVLKHLATTSWTIPATLDINSYTDARHVDS